MKEAYLWFLITIFGTLPKYWPIGVDFYLPALILCFQKKRFFWAFFLGITWVMIQEGSGNLPFGGILLWYMGVSFFYFFLKEFLTTKSLIFIILLSFISSIIYYISISIICYLQEITFNKKTVFNYSVIQFLFFPILWIIYFKLYNKFISTKTSLF